ncbi:SulP family inorganic anion transporter [Shewanella sp. GXUN23E]|uniref:SulP family inorganic anion transporter n=1 Tax=Shewanella sp. GXUN23E TaxID=3422498 RepID=UPI003D7C4861
MTAKRFVTHFMAWFPGVTNLANYQRDWFRADFTAALSVVAVALPVAIAYAQLTGVSPLMGLYSCILPMLIYALMGTSRQLIVGPDAATCAVIAAVVAPLAAGDADKYWQLVITMTMMTGVWCLIASRFRLGVFADFLSRPILLGLLNGVAITIMVGQLAKIFDFKYEHRYLLERVFSLADYYSQIHWLTLGISLLTLLVFILCKRLKPGWPASLLAITLASLVVWAGGLAEQGVKILGPIDVNAPQMQLPTFSAASARELVIPALNLALVSFVSMMLTARSFAQKNGYEIDADAEFRALGMANIGAALSHGFAISGADSRTAVNDAAGGKSQLVSIIAALLILIIALGFTHFLQFIPISALAVVLILASWSLIDIKTISAMRFRDNAAFGLSVLTLFSVILLGVIPGIMLAVMLGLFQFLIGVMRPTDHTLGLGKNGVLRSLDSTGKAKVIPGVMIFRFNSPLTYFNAVYFRRRLLARLKEQEAHVECVIIDAVSCLPHKDISVLQMLNDLQVLLKSRGCRMVLAGRKRQLVKWFEEAGIAAKDGGMLFRADIYVAIRMNEAYKQALSEGEAPQIKKREHDAVLAHSII